ncbi:protein CtaG [Thalassobacillus devorans]|uniref:Protein CtaG n=1 Tax=Thalassobacillus devorans TaxID=279813 RepID=A0ABQ1NMV3_9BACI|nr:cytochrome c oxidase assembly factor CtaG [Thalassobacillus devorans]NIK27775.1 putative membrane protein [Thalassobacillus devorans]GGC80347.1 protein CtaG [Thalassobacillus devorans]
MWLELQIFGFRALWSPYYFLFILLLAGLYYYVTGPGRHRFTDEGRPTGKQQALFYTGLIVLYIIKGSPIDLLAHIIFTAHMTQMALYYLLFPILIIKGIPTWMWKKLFNIPVVRPILLLLSKPLIALLLFNASFSLYHLPSVFDYAKTGEFAHAGITLGILFTAFLMWMSVFPPLDELDRLSELLKIGYIFANGVLITPACALIIFADTPLYATFTEGGPWVQALSLCVPPDVLSGMTGLKMSGPELFSPLSLLDDQQSAGIIMKVAQEIIFGAIIAKIFFTWFNKERDIIDPVPAHITQDS